MVTKDPEKRKEQNRRYYEKNRGLYRTKADAQRQRIREHMRLLKSQPCTDCGQTFPYYVMDFDHVSGTKLGNVSRLIHFGAWKRFLEEVEKCEVVCSNCHRIRTFERLSGIV